MVNIVLCGGSGTRLFPLSRALMPKQFLKLFEEESLFQKTIKRNSEICNENFIVSNDSQYFIANDQLEEVGFKNQKFLLETVGRNTAPAIALASFALPKDTIVLVTPSDHLIKNEKEYESVVKKAKELAESDFLVTFGIAPTYPEIGYGYIEAEGFNVKSFKEKPNIKLAKEYLKKGNYYWNSGMFCFKVSLFLEELKKYSPDIYEKSKIAYENAKKDNLIRIKLSDMEAIREDSIDYAVMERSDRVKVVPSDIDWNDVGSFDSLYSELDMDSDGNTLSDSINLNSKNNLIISNKKVSTIDVEDLIIVNSDDFLLVSKKGSSQKIKDVVAKLKKENSELANTHVEVHRPWGKYQVLEEANGYKIKKIIVKPKKRLSLQKHYHRNEHWIVVNGTAKVSVDDRETLVRSNESTYIQMGKTHRLENPGIIDLVMIEVQVGEYLGEDDIVRIEDDFERKG